jgi:hypothetical protein
VAAADHAVRAAAEQQRARKCAREALPELRVRGGEVRGGEHAEQIGQDAAEPLVHGIGDETDGAVSVGLT